MSGIGAKVLSLYLAYRRPFVLAAVGLFIAWIGFGEIVAAHDVYDGLCNVSAPRTQCPGMGTSGLTVFGPLIKGRHAPSEPAQRPSAQVGLSWCRGSGIQFAIKRRKRLLKISD
jgi:hypothetical protein